MVAVNLHWGPGTLLPQSPTTGTGTTQALDDADNKVALVFCVPKDGVINRIGFYITAKAGVPPDFEVALVTVDAAGGPTTTLYGGSAAQTFTPGAVGSQTVTLTTPATVVAGDVIAAVIRPGATPPSATDSITVISAFPTGASNQDMGALPRAMRFTTAWANLLGVPAVAVQYQTTNVWYGYYPGDTTMLSASMGLDTTPDERGALFTLPLDMTCYGGRLQLGNVASNQGYELRLYNAADTVLATGTISDEDIGGGTVAPLDLFWDEIVLTKDTEYRLTFRPTGTTAGWTWFRFVVGAAGARDWFPEGSRWQGTSRTDLGAWTDTTTQVPMMALWIKDIAVSGGGAAGALVGGGLAV